MALQTSGAISLSNIATEFGGTAPHAINEYYRGGGIVPDTDANSSIPTSGQIDLNDFYGGDSTPAATLEHPPAGNLYNWGAQNTKYGSGANGQSVTGNDGNRSSPVQTAAGGSNWQYSGRAMCHSSAAMKSDGRMWFWGYNVNNIGLTAATNTSSPVQMNTSTDWTSFGITIENGWATKSDGKHWQWGVSTNRGDSDWVTAKTSPNEIVGGGTDWEQQYWSSSVGSGIKTDGRLWVWGQNYFGQLGQNNTTGGGNTTFRSSPVQTVSGGTNWAKIAAATSGRVGVKTDGRLWTWGVTGYLGDNSQNYRSSPVQTVAGGTNWEYPGASTGEGCGFAVKTDGRFWTWGEAGTGGVGQGGTTSRYSPVQTASGGTNWEYPTRGGGIVGGIKTDGRLWSWGENTNGGLGDNTNSHKFSPIQTAHGGTTWRHMTSGYDGAAPIQAQAGILS